MSKRKNISKSTKKPLNKRTAKTRLNEPAAGRGFIKLPASLSKASLVVFGVLFAGVACYFLFFSGAASTVILKDTNYSFPATAKFVSPSGSDNNDGSQGAPWRSIQKATGAAAAGSTIVIRDGTYREPKITIYNKALTLQPYPHEKVWIKGSVEVAGWVSDGSAWRKDGWTYKFPHVDPVQPNQIIDSAYPLAGYADMVFIDGSPLRQVGSRAAVVAGTFYVDETNQKLYIGDNPAGKLIEGAATQNLLEIYNGSGTKILGLGFAHAASNSLSASAAVTTSRSNNVLIENNTFAYNAASGFQVGELSSDNVVRGNEMVLNGLVGADTWGSPQRLTVEQNHIAGNNQEHFSIHWSAGGFKGNNMIDSVIQDNIVEDNIGPGIWCDNGCRNTNIVRNIVQNNVFFGIFYEISNGSIIGSNIVTNNAGVGGSNIYISESTNVKVFNNTVASRTKSNVRSIDVNSNFRQITTGVIIKNNIFSQVAPSGLWAVRVQDDLNRYTAESMVSAMDYNAYFRQASSAPPILIRWGKVNGADDFNTLTAFRTAKFLEQHSLAIDNQTSSPFFVDEAGGNYQLQPGSPAVGKGEPLPADVAAAIGVSSGVAVDIGVLRWPIKPQSVPATDTSSPSTPSGIASPSQTANTINLSWAFSSDNVGVIAYDVYRNNAKVATVGTNSHTDTGLLAGTAYSYYVTARDSAGNVSLPSTPINVSTLAAVPVARDVETPTVSISSPINGATIGNGTSIKAVASDNVGIVKMEVYIDGSLKTSNTNITSISYTWNSKKATRGAHAITVKAYDAAGNIGQNSVTVYR